MDKADKLPLSGAFKGNIKIVWKGLPGKITQAIFKFL
jgi:hypothetical protein